MAGTSGKLFGLHVGDAHQRLGAEDGLAFGSIHTSMAIELIFWLKKIKYDGSIYFDTFPKNEDPVRECELNIRRFKSFSERCDALIRQDIEHYISTHDSMSVLELLEQSVDL